MGLEAHQPKKDVSLALDLADTPEKKAMIRLMSSHLALGRPYLGPPGMNPDRKAELHKAFRAVMADPELRAEYAKASGGEEPEPTGGEDMQKLLLETQATPIPAVERLRILLNP
jgi:hypothetical protein